MFTHFGLELEVWSASDAALGVEGWWSADVGALPTVFKKAALL